MDNKIFYVDRSKINFKLPYLVDNSGTDTYVSLRDVYNCIAMTPIADVVPVHEVRCKLQEKLYPLHEVIGMDKEAWYTEIDKLIAEILCK